MDPVNNDAVQRALVVQDMLIAHQVSETWSTLQSLSSSVVGLLGQERTAPPVQPPALSASSRASVSALGTSMFCLTLPFPSVTQMTWTDVVVFCCNAPWCLISSHYPTGKAMLAFIVNLLSGRAAQ